MKEITGAKKVTIKRGCAGTKVRGQAKKRCIFSKGELFFLLTGPLMGDPVVLFNNEIRKRFNLFIIKPSEFLGIVKQYGN
jgi:hypothetical protein